MKTKLERGKRVPLTADEDSALQERRAKVAVDNQARAQAQAVADAQARFPMRAAAEIYTWAVAAGMSPSAELQADHDTLSEAGVI